jgi:hypothetical protein
MTKLLFLKGRRILRRLYQRIFTPDASCQVILDPAVCLSKFLPNRGSGNFAEIEFQLSQREDGQPGLEFIDAIRGGAIPRVGFCKTSLAGRFFL